MRLIIYLELNENINLISMEKLEPGSPEHWPEKSKYVNSKFESVGLLSQTLSQISVPGVNDFAKLNSIANRDEIPSWTQGLSQEDINSMHRNIFKKKKNFCYHFFINYFLQ